MYIHKQEPYWIKQCYIESAWRQMFLWINMYTHTVHICIHAYVKFYWMCLLTPRWYRIVNNDSHFCSLPNFSKCIFIYLITILFHFLSILIGQIHMHMYIHINRDRTNTYIVLPPVSMRVYREAWIRYSTLYILYYMYIRT